MDWLHFLNEMHTHGISKFLHIVMLECLKELMKNVLLEFI